MTTLPDPPPLELEDDIAELVCALAQQEVQDDVFCNGWENDGTKQQLRDVLAKLIDDRIAAALAKLTR